MLAFAVACSWALPGLSDLIGLVCSFTDSVIMYILPTALWLWLWRSGLIPSRGTSTAVVGVLCTAVFAMGCGLFMREVQNLL